MDKDSRNRSFTILGVPVNTFVQQPGYDLLVKGGRVIDSAKPGLMHLHILGDDGFANRPSPVGRRGLS